MEKVTVTTKPNGAGRNWLEIGHFKDDDFGRSNWIKKGDLNQDRHLKVDRQHSDRGDTLDWVILIPENYPWTIVKISYDRLNPRSYEILWPLADQVETTEDASSASSPLLIPTQQPPLAQDSKTEAEKIERVYQLAEGNDELIRLLNQLLPRSPE